MTDLADLYADLRRACDAAGGQSEWARRHGISAQYVSDVVNARKGPGPKIYRALQWKKTVIYQRSNQA